MPFALKRYLIPKRVLGLSALILILLASCESGVQSQSSDGTAGQDTQQPASANKETLSKKQKFEEEKKRLESGDEAVPAVIPADPDQTFFVSPAKATMLVGESWLFSSFDVQGKTLTGETVWSVSNSSVAEVSTERAALVTAKSQGTVTIGARTSGRYAEAIVTVLPGNKLPPLTIRWLAPQIPGFTIKKMFAAGPSESAVAVTFFEQNAQGEALLRAFTSNGRQLWMKRGSDLSPRNGAH
jgi:hypothetical protein